jgi:hypothetical protein
VVVVPIIIIIIIITVRRKRVSPSAVNPSVIANTTEIPRIPTIKIFVSLSLSFSLLCRRGCAGRLFLSLEFPLK